MDIIEKTRELGKLIQEQDCYKKLKEAEAKADIDTELQDLIGKFNLKRISINNEASKNEHDQEKMQALNQEMRAVYAKIMQNENMLAYNEAKDEYDLLVNRIQAIINNSINGDDPETTDYDPGCTGSCDSCAGCH